MRNQLNHKTRIAGTALALFSLLIACIPHAASADQAFKSTQTNIETPTSNASSRPDSSQVAEEFGKLPLSFEQNKGQTDKAVKFLARNPRYTLFLTDTEAVFALRKFEGAKRVRRQVLRMQLVGANSQPRVEGRAEFTGKSNYFIGDSTQWHRDVSTYARVAYDEVYPGVDMIYYGEQQQLEYDFIVAPQADPQAIKLSFTGASQVMLDNQGDLHLKLGDKELVQPAPFIYQEVKGARKQVAGRFVIEGNQKSKTNNQKSVTVGFEVKDYDHSLPLVIDPKLLFSTYVGGNTEFIDIKEGTGDSANGVALDSSGNVYITGNTDSTDFPATSGAYQTELELRGDDACLIDGPLKCGDAYVLKLNSTGTQIMYATYLGGHNSDEGRAIAVDSQNRAYITGGTDPFNAGNFCINPYLWPTTSNAYQNKPCYGGRGDADAFFAVLNSSGSDLVYSTYYGGGPILGRGDTGVDIGNSIAIDSSGNGYIAGETNSNDLPDKNAFQTDRASDDVINDGFVAKFDPDASSGNASFLYGSYLGGAGEDIAHGISVDAVGNAYVVGETASTNLTTRGPSGQALQPLQRFFNGGASDGFVAKVDVTNASGANSLVYLTYYGGIGRDVLNAIVVEAATQRAHITGRSDNATGFPLLNAFDTSATGTDAIVAMLNSDGTAQFYSSFLGGTGSDDGRAIALDAANNVYLTGQTLSSSFPHINAFQNTLASADGDAFVTKISAVVTPSQPKILYSSFLGGAQSNGGGSGKEFGNGIAVDKKGNVILAGTTASNAFPTTAGTVKPSSPGVVQTNTDAFVAKVETTFADTIGVYNPPTNQFRLRNSNTPGGIDQTITFGQAGDIPVVGDWTGRGIKDAGVFRPSTGQFLIRKLTVVCNPFCIPVFQTVTINFGQNGDLPVSGDWNNDGIDSVGVFRPSAGQFFLADQNVQFPSVDHSPIFGTAGDLPIAGDWNSDGRDTVGVYRPSATQFFMTNQDVLNPSVDISAIFGAVEDLPVAGDWDGDGKDTFGVWRPSVATFFLSNNNAAVDLTIPFGTNGDLPVAGDWDGKP
ncbi:MAG TPA: SBBP repeat-containing protein [Pyrinomonadaceae bacterium]